MPMPCTSPSVPWPPRFLLLIAQPRKSQFSILPFLPLPTSEPKEHEKERRQARPSFLQTDKQPSPRSTSFARWCLETTGLGTAGSPGDRAVSLPAAGDSTGILLQKIIFRELLAFQLHWRLADSCHHSTDDEP